MTLTRGLATALQEWASDGVPTGQSALMEPLTVFTLFGASVAYSAYFQVSGNHTPFTLLSLYGSFLVFALCSVANLVRAWSRGLTTIVALDFIGYYLVGPFATVLLLAPAIVDIATRSIYSGSWIQIFAFFLATTGLGVLFIGLWAIVPVQAAIEWYRELDQSSPAGAVSLDAWDFLITYDLYGGALRRAEEIIPGYTMLGIERQARLLAAILESTVPGCSFTAVGEVAVEMCIQKFIRDSERWRRAADALRSQSAIPFDVRTPQDWRVKNLLLLEKIMNGDSPGSAAPDHPSTATVLVERDTADPSAHSAASARAAVLGFPPGIEMAPMAPRSGPGWWADERARSRATHPQARSPDGLPLPCTANQPRSAIPRDITPFGSAGALLTSSSSSLRLPWPGTVDSERLTDLDTAHNNVHRGYTRVRGGFPTVSSDSVRDLQRDDGDNTDSLVPLLPRDAEEIPGEPMVTVGNTAHAPS